MSARLTRVFETDPLAAQVAPDLRAFVALAVKVTGHPEKVTPEDVRAAFSAALSPRQYFDAAGVMITFNFITRVANALGVEPEIPGWMRRIEPLRQLGLRAMASFFRLFVDLRRKGVHGPAPSEHLAALRTLFLDLRLGDLPAWLNRLSFAPPVLAALRELLESLVRRDAATGTIGLDANQFMAIGRAVLRPIPNAETLTALADGWQPIPRPEPDAKRAALVARFANDVATRSYTLTSDRIDELRAAGLDDAEVLDVVATAALWSAAARLEVLTGCLPSRDPSSEDARQEGMPARIFRCKWPPKIETVGWAESSRPTGAYRLGKGRLSPVACCPVGLEDSAHPTPEAEVGRMATDIQSRPGQATPTVVDDAPSQPAATEKPYKPDHLGGLRRFALAITVFNLLGHFWFGFEQSYAQPLASLASAYVTQLLLESLEAWAQRRRPGFTRSFTALSTSLLSAHISGLACAMLLYANDRIWVVCFASAVAIASKTLFRMPVGGVKGAWPLLLFQFVLFLLLLQTGEATSHWVPVAPPWLLAFLLGALALVAILPPAGPTRHYLNPSNFGIAVTLLLFPSVGIAAPYQFTENLGSVGDWAVPLAIICTGSILNTWFTGRIHLALAWVGAYALQAVISSLILWYSTGFCPVASRLSGMTGVAFILFTFYMVTDPATTPERPQAQVAFGASVAVVYGLLLMQNVVFGLFAALVIVCVARGMGMYLLANMRSPRSEVV